MWLHLIYFIDITYRFNCRLLSVNYFLFPMALHFMNCFQQFFSKVKESYKNEKKTFVVKGILLEVSDPPQPSS